MKKPPPNPSKGGEKEKEMNKREKIENNFKIWKTEFCNLTIQLHSLDFELRASVFQRS